MLANWLTMWQLKRFFRGWRNADLRELFTVHHRIRASQVSE
jgi:hypothetical protein